MRATACTARLGWTFAPAASPPAPARQTARLPAEEVPRRVVDSISVQEAFDDPDEGLLLLEEEGVPGVGVQHELRFRDEGRDHVVVRDRIEAVNGAIGDEGRHGDA